MHRPVFGWWCWWMSKGLLDFVRVLKFAFHSICLAAYNWVCRYEIKQSNKCNFAAYFIGAVLYAVFYYFLIYTNKRTICLHCLCSCNSFFFLRCDCCRYFSLFHFQYFPIPFLLPERNIDSSSMVFFVSFSFARKLYSWVHEYIYEHLAIVRCLLYAINNHSLDACLLCVCVCVAFHSFDFAKNICSMSNFHIWLIFHSIVVNSSQLNVFYCDFHKKKYVCLKSKSCNKSSKCIVYGFLFIFHFKMEIQSSNVGIG